MARKGEESTGSGLMECVLYLDDSESEFVNCDPNDCDRTACRYHPEYDVEEEKSDLDFPPIKETKMDKFIGSFNTWQFFLFMLFLMVSPLMIGFAVYHITTKMLEVQQSYFLTVVFVFLSWYMIFGRKYRGDIIDGYPR